MTRELKAPSGTGRTATPQQEAAADWLLRLEAGEPDTLPAFRAWLAADPRHRAAWDQVARAWQGLGELPPPDRSRWAASPASQSSSPPSSVPASAHRPRRLAAAAGAVALCLLLLFVLPGLLLGLQADVRTGTGEVRRVLLQDGSVVHMAPETALALEFDAAERRVRLLQGQAFFEVRREPARPFRVEAARAAATVLGTAFDVRLAEESVAVGVREGRVAVAYAGTRLEPPLEPGERMVIGQADGQVRRSERPTDQIALWVDGRLFVDGATVAEVVERLRPYHTGWLVLAGDSLAQRRVTGLYDLSRPERALAALVEPYGGTLHRLGPLTVIAAGALGEGAPAPEPEASETFDDSAEK
jgi:transmembrane sensor